MARLQNTYKQETGRWINNRVENFHLLFRRLNFIWSELPIPIGSVCMFVPYLIFFHGVNILMGGCQSEI